ncbi:MAG TPA: hypothetical protein VKE51_34860 [Vicinamibacterales bacterium]|nr:hypothetical protein [Vicinamibacterales bacterium]
MSSALRAAQPIRCRADGDLIVIPIRSVKYVRVSPAPPHLPAGSCATRA